MSTSKYLLELDNISKSYSTAPGQAQLFVLKDVTINVLPGQIVTIVGPSGSGKSTLLNIIGLLDKPTSGSLKLNGMELSKMPEDKKTRMRNRNIGFIFQLHHLLPHLTVLENVLVPTLATKEDKSGHALELLKRVGLENRRDYFPGLLSGGERQRAAVVRALINRPQLILADEPTGALDQHTAREIGALLAELNLQEKVTLITVTHSVELAAMLGNIYTLTEGKLQPNENV
ncbi:ABC transporter ATP-binding protein [candidate division KSB1 bacterium]|nr:ABC transporter ATP-binding protein [candidate division KSB1 bacterium]